MARTTFDPLALIPPPDAIRERLHETLTLAERLRILLELAERLQLPLATAAIPPREQREGGRHAK